ATPQYGIQFRADHRVPVPLETLACKPTRRPRAVSTKARSLLFLMCDRRRPACKMESFPGAVPAQPEDIDPVVATYSRELEIVETARALMRNRRRWLPTI